MSYIKFRTILFLFVFICGCKDNPTDNDKLKTETDYGTYDISTYMPFSIGNRWIYNYRTIAEMAVLDRRMQDSLRINDQLLIFGYGEDVLVNPPATNLPTTGYYGHRGGTIYFTDLPEQLSYPILPLLASPIVENHTWWTDAWGHRDTFRIVSVASGNFNNRQIDTVVAVRRWHEGWIDTTWFARTVGILKEVSYSSGTLSVTRQLDSFLPTP